MGARCCLYAGGSVSRTCRSACCLACCWHAGVFCPAACEYVLPSHQLVWASAAWHNVAGFALIGKSVLSGTHAVTAWLRCARLEAIPIACVGKAWLCHPRRLVLCVGRYAEGNGRSCYQWHPFPSISFWRCRHVRLSGRIAHVFGVPLFPISLSGGTCSR